MTRRDKMQVDLTTPDKPMVLVPLMAGQLADVEELCRREMDEYEKGSRSNRSYAALADLMRIATSKLRTGQAVKRAAMTGGSVPEVDTANQIIRLLVNRLHPADIERIAKVDAHAAKRIHSLLRDARVTG